MENAICDEAHIGTDAGNTKIPRQRARCYVFTLNNPSEKGFSDLAHLAQIFRNFGAKSWVYQLEEGEQKTPHVQGVIQFENPKDFSCVKEMISKAHWEKCKNFRKSILYCSKTPRLEGPYYHNVKVKKDLKTITNLYKWQQQILDIINSPPDDRKIYWLVDKDGNLGKTALCKFLCHNYNALYLSGKSNDIKYGITKYLENNELQVALLDYPRSLEQFISYEAIESIKNGIFYNGKYESGMVMFNPPHIFCFSNFRPEITSLSQDRWVKCYVEGDELKMDGW